MATTSWFRCDPTRKFGKESFAKNYVQQRIEKDNARRRLIMQEVEAEKKRKLEETEKTKDKKVTEGNSNLWWIRINRKLEFWFLETSFNAKNFFYPGVQKIRDFENDVSIFCLHVLELAEFFLKLLLNFCLQYLAIFENKESKCC